MISLADFRAAYPEFARVADPLVQVALDKAEKRTSAEVFGDQTDEAHGLLAAHLLAISPMGRESRLQKESRVTTYLTERTWLEHITGCGWGVL